MKGLLSFLHRIRALHLSGELDDATCRELNVTLAKLRHCHSTRDRKGAERYFEELCDLLSDILSR